MKSYDSRTYNLNDFFEWDAAKQLQLNPKFQRRSVWTEKAKSYLIDTILRGKPIPKIFIRQQINVSTKTSLREVVDGQQRLRTILSFIKDGFTVSKRHHPEYGGTLFSHLPEEVKAQILSYEVSVDLLINLPDAEILDIFSRLNSYAVILNEQEKINSDHFSSFKILADKIGHKYNAFWGSQGILTPKQIVRMLETNLVADLLISMIEGIKSKKQIKKFYDVYESAFEHDTSELELRFDEVISKIAEVYPEGLSDTEFRRPHLFYSLFTAIDHCMHGQIGLPSDSSQTGLNVEAARDRLERVDEIFSEPDITKLNVKERQFLEDSRRATTDEVVRRRRAEMLVNLIVS